jgi:hypothetical protein
MAIGALAGAAAGAIGTMQSGKREQEALERQKDSAWQQYLLGKEYGDRQFALQKGEALGQLDAQQRNLDAQLGLSVNDYNTALLAQAFGIQDARIQTGSAVGASVAAEAAGGTRGNAANEMARSYAAQGLERNIEAQERQNKDSLNRMAAGANLSLSAIGRERASWQPGGFRVLEKAARDDYNRGLARLGQSDFSWQMSQAAPAGLDYFTNMMGGAQQGMALAGSINSFADSAPRKENGGIDWKQAWFGIGKKEKTA